MKLKASSQKKHSPKSPQRTFNLTLGLILIAFLVGIYSGAQLNERGWGYFAKKVTKMKNIFNIIPNYIRSFSARPERIAIDISFENYQKIAYTREKAKQKTVLTSKDKQEYVPIKITHRGKIYEARMRLKGDFSDQLGYTKWPLRIRMRGDQTLFGMKIFQIQSLHARNYLYEWLWLKAMKREGLIAMRYDFIDVTINGKHIGIFALEEHFEKRLLENNERREGPIILFSEHAEIENHGHFGYPNNKGITYHVAEIDFSRRSEVLEDPKMKEQMLQARAILEGFRQGDLSVGEAFDIRQIAKYHAMLDLFNARHASKYGNFRLYYNPITSKLEPIAYDAETVGYDWIFQRDIFMENWWSIHFSPTRLFFRNNKFFAYYIQELNRISQTEYLDKLFEELDPEIEEKLKIIYQDHPYFEFSKKTFYDKQEYIQKILTMPVLINAYFKNFIPEENILELDIVNIRSFPVHIQSVKLSNGIEFVSEREFALTTPNFHPATPKGETFRFKGPSDFEWEESFKNGMELFHEYPIIGNSRSTKVIPWVHYDKNRIAKDLLLHRPSVSHLEFIVEDKIKREYRIRPGKWVIDQNIILRSNYSLVIEEGTEINLVNGAKILTYNPISFIGTREKPIRIFSEDGTGQGIGVFNAYKVSNVKYVIFDGLSFPKHASWELTGAINFYNSPVIFKNCKFLNSQAEDALNVIHSKFMVQDSLFSNNVSDAIDSDFSAGRIENSVFLQSGNDAIDTSGSQLWVIKTKIVEVGDKGISAGEKSQVIVQEVEIEKATIGIASKDLSEVQIDQVKISDSKVGFAAYQKKSEFGTGKIESTEPTFINVEIPYQTDLAS